MKNSVRSVLRAVRILELIGKAGSKGVTEISRELKSPKSSVYQIISTLVDQHIIEKDSDSNLYHLGLKLFELGNLARFNLEISEVSNPYLRELNEKLDETVHLTILENGEILYINCFESTKRLRTHSAIGEKAPLHCTGVGKAMLAYLPVDEIEKIIQEKGLQKFTENTITNKAVLLKELKKIAQCGYAIDNMEHEDGVICFAAPIWNHEGKVIASISVAGPSQRITLKMESILAESVMETTRGISKKLGYKLK
ncbi:MAG: IclR family transcriptional regulator [Desulfobacteraceae bacterium]|nr:IclR family transcriptional regulator [Desulfobacteraceae bacterium]